MNDQKLGAMLKHAWKRFRQRRDPPIAKHATETLKLQPTVTRAAIQEATADRPVWARPALVTPQCWCETCDLARNYGTRTRMSVCPICGDKRCARARHHSLACDALERRRRASAPPPASRMVDDSDSPSEAAQRLLQDVQRWARESAANDCHRPDPEPFKGEGGSFGGGGATASWDSDSSSSSSSSSSSDSSSSSSTSSDY